MKHRYLPSPRIIYFGFVAAVLLSLLIACDDNGMQPAEVSGLQAVAGDSQVTLAWTDPADIDLDHIEITWLPDAPLSPTFVPAAVQTATITGLKNGTAYSFTVRTVDSSGNMSGGVTQTAIPAVAGSFYVDPGGSDSNPGSLLQPWQTIQKAADTVAAGSSVYVRDGIYNEQVVIRVSGTAADGFIAFRNYEEETPVLDGTGLTVPDDDNGMFLIVSRSYIIIKGFEIRNYRSSIRNIVPVGIHIRGTSNHIRIIDNRIHNIETNAPVDLNRAGADAHGIAVFGTEAPASVNNIIIEGNEIYDLKLGSSEALVVNGNVETFSITGNTVHDVDNIGIDVIGFEGKAPAPEFDQARNGIIRSNRIYNVSSFGNPSYGNEYSAGGIYVDGGRDTIIEMNTVYSSDIGIEIAGEHQSGATSGITVRNNFLYSNALKGISMGGFDKLRGSTEDCVVVNNTLYNNNTLQDGSGEIGLAFNTFNNIIKNNIFYAGAQSLFIENNFTENSGNMIDYNLYFAPAGSDESLWQWMDVEYEGFEEYKAATGNDAHSFFVNPDFADLSAPDLHLQPRSPAIDAGEEVSEAGDYDIDGQDRIQGNGIDIGADEQP